jgi:catechol 2,3-dioxygenase-like lactoylglutathione lyase family enzyme
MKAKLNIITLGVKDLSKAIAFYETGLGWTRSKASQDNIIFFSLNGIVLALYPRDLLAEDATLSPEGNGFRGVSLAYNTQSEKEVDEIIEKVKGLGAEIVKQPQKVFWGGYSSYFKDPDGHLFEVAYNPFFEMDEKGNLLI